MGEIVYEASGAASDLIFYVLRTHTDYDELRSGVKVATVSQSK